MLLQPNTWKDQLKKIIKSLNTHSDNLNLQTGERKQKDKMEINLDVNNTMSTIIIRKKTYEGAIAPSYK